MCVATFDTQFKARFHAINPATDLPEVDPISPTAQEVSGPGGTRLILCQGGTPGGQTLPLASCHEVEKVKAKAGLALETPYFLFLFTKLVAKY